MIRTTRFEERCVLLALGLLLSLATGIGAEDPSAARRPVADWIEIFRREADARRDDKTPRLAAIRLAAGWTMPGLSGKPFQRDQVAEELPIFLDWMESDGYALLERILDGESLTAEEEPFRPILLGLYLRAGIDHAKPNAAQGRAFVLDVDRLPGGREACLAYREAVNLGGQRALYRGYLTGELSREEIDAIRLYRIAQGQRVVGESFLPMHLGLHPLADGEFNAGSGGGHGSNRMIELVHGKPFYDFRLKRLRSVLASPRYSDRLDASYHLTFSLRPEGVIEFLTHIDGYAPFQNDRGATVVRLREQRLELRPEDDPADSVRLADRVGQRPVLLYINDPIDGPVTEQFPAFETIYQGYGEKVDCWFVAVDIHDWYYSGMQDMLSRGTPGRYPNIHAYCEEERARKAKNRYLESPHATFPCLIGDNYQSVKNYYATGGGANHWVLIDRAGVIAEYTTNQDGNLNMVETAIRRVLGNDGLMAAESEAFTRFKDEDAAPGVVMPENKRMCLHAAEVVSVDAANREMTVRCDGIGPDGVVTVRLAPSARICRDEFRTDLAEVKPGETVAIDFYLDDYIDTQQATESDLPAPIYGSWRREYVVGDQRLRMTLRGHYGVMRRRWYLDDAAVATPIPARCVRVLTPDQIASATSEPSVMWMSGRVTAADCASNRITVARAPLSAESAKGYAFYREFQERGRPVALTEDARLRLAEVERWLRAPDEEVTVLADDATDYCLNGSFGGGVDDIAVGDFVGVRYYPDRQRGRVLVPHTIRISKPIKVSKPSRSRE